MQEMSKRVLENFIENYVPEEPTFVDKFKEAIVSGIVPEASPRAP